MKNAWKYELAQLFSKLIMKHQISILVTEENAALPL